MGKDSPFVGHSHELDTLRTPLIEAVAHDARLGAEEVLEGVLCRCVK